MEQPRPPIVTILGHVDHGKTTLLDFIRKTSVAAKEHGGITQAIGAYQIKLPKTLITFIDTPGHAAFEKMRSRGASVADIAVLVVAVDDGIMPQTVEAIKHIKGAGVPMIVALNKVDLPGVNVKVQSERIKKQLSDQGVLVEEYGGDVPIVMLSAKSGEGVDTLLETINLLSEIHEFKADPERAAAGVVIESRMDKFKGPIATLLIRDGTLRRGEAIKAGETSGKIKGMFDWAGKAIQEATPSMPVEILGFQTVPAIGAKLGEEALNKKLEPKVLSLIDRLKETKNKVLNVVVKADKEGSLEAVEGMLAKFNEGETHLKILFSGTGDILDSDVELANTSRAIILGFNVSITPSAKKMAEVEHTLIRTYNIIYELVDEVKEVVEGMLIPGKVEEVFGRAQVLAEFPYGKGERIAGGRVVEGVITKGPRIRVVRGEEVVGEGKIKSLKKAKEEVNRVEKGAEFGILFDAQMDFKIGDVVESFRTY